MQLRRLLRDRKIGSWFSLRPITRHASMREITESFQAPPIPSPAAANSVRAVRRQRWLLLLIFLVMAGLQIALATRQPLWVDEIFSVAMATGHSLEHPAATAKPEQGDFVEPNEPVPASLFNRYTQHESPPASPVRVIRGCRSPIRVRLYIICCSIFGRCFLGRTISFFASFLSL